MGQIETAFQTANDEAEDMTGGRIELSYVTLTGSGGAGSRDESSVIGIRGNDLNNDDLPILTLRAGPNG